MTENATRGESGRWACSRHHADGQRCPHRTSNADRWCRLPDCPGYQRSSPELSPEAAGSIFGTAKHIRETGHLEIDLELDDIEHVRIAQRALDAYRFHHGGSEEAARAQITAMLEDFVLKSARQINERGFVTLGRSGYHLVLSPKQNTIVGYRTIHRERTWAQVQAGVPSRFGSKPVDALLAPYKQPATAPGEPRPSADIADLSAEQVRVTGRAMSGWLQICKTQPQTSEEMLAAEHALRSNLVVALQGWESATINDNGCHYLTTSDAGWLLSPDLKALVLVRKPKVAEADPDSVSDNSGLAGDEAVGSAGYPA